MLVTFHFLASHGGIVIGLPILLDDNLNPIVRLGTTVSSHLRVFPLIGVGREEPDIDISGARANNLYPLNGREVDAGIRL
jgi:hypothetical protein